MSCKKFDAVRFDSHGTFQASALLRQRRQRTSSGPSPRMCYTKHKVVALELGEVYNIVCYMELSSSFLHWFKFTYFLKVWQLRLKWLKSSASCEKLVCNHEIRVFDLQCTSAVRLIATYAGMRVGRSCCTTFHKYMSEFYLHVHCLTNQTHLHLKHSAQGLVLKWRKKATQMAYYKMLCEDASE